MDKPKKKTQLFKAGQIEEYQIGLEEFEEIPCPTCDGSGEIVDDWEGIEYTQECSDCDGFGFFCVSTDS